jgi:enediyne biosynthesis protein E4
VSGNPSRIARRFRTQRGRRVLLCLAAALVVGVGASPATGAAAPTVDVKLRAIGPTSVPQGVAFTTGANLRNPTQEVVNVTVGFDLVEVSTGDLVDAFAWQATVPAEGTLSTRVPLTSSTWFAGQGSFQVRALIDGLTVGTLDFEVTAPTVAPPLFQDVTAQAGVSTTLGPSECGGWAAGAAWGDVNGDGYLDLFLPRNASPALLWINDGAGHFVDEAAARGVADGSGVGMGAVFADYDNDGDQDLFVADRGPDHLYQNDGTGHFTDVAGSAGVSGTTDDVSASWGDYDRDGHLDLYVVSNSQCAPPHMYQQDRLYHNNGDGTFTDATSLLPAALTHGAGYEAAWFDYDGDGDQDLYLANDRWGPTPDHNHLWRNDGPGGEGGWTFTDVSTSSGTDYFINSMGIAIGDIDRDLDLDFAISNIAGNVMARNNGDGTFTDVAATVGVQRPLVQVGLDSVTWGLVFADLNLDGYEDLFASAGSIYDLFEQPNQVFVGAGNGTFEDLSAPSGADDPGVGRGVAIGDYDRDGLLDLVVVNRNGDPVLYHNVSAVSGHWLEVNLNGTASNADGCGARLTLSSSTGRQVREAFCGSVSLSSGNDAFVHFGLGSATTITRLVVEWPSGRRQVVRNVAADQVLDVTEPA